MKRRLLFKVWEFITRKEISFFFLVLILLLNSYGVKAQQTLGFEGNTGSFPGGSGSSEVATVETNNPRTGLYSVKLVTTSTSSNKYWYTNSISEGPSASGVNVHCILWVKSTAGITDFTATMRYSSTSPPSGGGSSQGLGQSSPASLNPSDVVWQRVTGSATNNAARYYFPAPTRAAGVAATIYVDDIVMYKSSSAITDILEPNQPANVSGSFTGGKALLTWTSGGDNTATGTTGVQASMILKYTGSGTPVAPTLNQQANYSVNDIIATDWIVVKNNSADVATNEDMGIISSTTNYTVYHRDLAYNWSSGTLVSVSTTLPVSLTSFKAITQTDVISLNWATSSENNADKFVVERRTATSAFVSINEVKAKGKAGIYILSDKNVANGETYYYRLKMVDNDGTYKYSALSSATFTLNATNTASVYPNPATNSVTVSYPQTGNTVSSLSIVDAKGAGVLTAVIPANSTQKTIDVSGLKTGIYIININTKEGRKTLKLVKN